MLLEGNLVILDVRLIKLFSIMYNEIMLKIVL